jgi:hypothetical protein
MDKTVDYRNRFFGLCNQESGGSLHAIGRCNACLVFLASVACAEEIIRILFSSMEINTPLFKGDLALWNDPRH